MKNFFKIIIVVLITLVVADSAYSIPAFARKYNFSCNVCHYVTPKLKPFGEEFAGNGFQIPDKEPSRFYKKTGDDLLMLMRELPIALRLELYGQYESTREANPDLRTPWLLKLMSGGNIYKDISYYFYFFFSERGDVAGIEDAFVMFNNVVSKNVDLDMYVGQFQVSDPLFKRELRLEQEKNLLFTEIENACLNFNRGKDEYNAALSNFEYNTKSFEGVEKRFETGLVDVTIFAAAKNSLFRAETEALRTKLQLLIRKLTIQFYSIGEYENIVNK